MKFCRFISKADERVGCIVDDSRQGVADISEIVGACDLLNLIDSPELMKRVAAYLDAGTLGSRELLKISDVTLLPPVARPGKIVCLAGNYRAHITESGYVEPAARANFTQQLFLKPSTSLLGHGGVIELGKTNHRVGWEAELAVVIGKRGKSITKNNALDHIFGYTILNDISERGLNSNINDRHLREMDGFCDWLAGKWFDGFAPCGPCIVTTDELPRPHELEIKFYLNGELRQQGSTAEMIFSIPEQIEYISSIMTLEPGDIISTGTPSGAGLGDKRSSLADGDKMTCEIEGIGLLNTTVRWRG